LLDDMEGRLTAPGRPGLWSRTVSIAGAAIAFSGAVFGGVPAQAGTIDARPNEGLFFEAAAAEANDLRITRPDGGGSYTVVDSGAPLTALGACVSTGANSATCPAGEPWVRAYVVSVDLGDLDDTADITAEPGGLIVGGDGADVVSASADRFGFIVEGGGGNDTLSLGDQGWLEGNEGDDKLTATTQADPARMRGGPGDDWLVGSSGDQRLYGGEGDDTLEPGNGSILVGGPGGDEFWPGWATSFVVSYRRRVNPVSVDPGGDPDDGEAGEGDTLHSPNFPAGYAGSIWGGSGPDHLSTGSGIGRLRGFEGDDLLDATSVPEPGYDGAEAIGGEGNDTLLGGRGSDRLLGDRGDDTLRGGLGGDRMLGGPGTDVIQGGRHRDLLNGNGGDDSLAGGYGPDWLFGGWGDDTLEGGRGRDRAHGGHGRDVLWMRDGLRDYAVDGGPGRDRADVDTRLDLRIRSIERFGEADAAVPLLAAPARWGKRL
jgi:Ca2+-binding RTX toxin-like protein